MRIQIKDLTFETIIGLLPIERETPQRVILNCAIDYTYNEDKFIDYSLIKDYLIATTQRQQFLTLEKAVSTLTDGLKELFPDTNNITLEIIKPDIFNNCHVSITHTIT